jgi:hypothetical protein
MKFVATHWLLAIVSIAVAGTDAPASLATEASLMDTVVSFVYDPRDGNVGLDLYRYAPGTGVHFTIDPSVALFTGPVPDGFDCSHGLSQCSPGLFMSAGIVPDNALLSFGPYAEPGLPMNYLAENVSGFVMSDGTQGVVIEDLYYVPEPSETVLPAVLVASTLGRRRLRRFQTVSIEARHQSGVSAIHLARLRRRGTSVRLPRRVVKMSCPVGWHGSARSKEGV